MLVGLIVLVSAPVLAAEPAGEPESARHEAAVPAPVPPASPAADAPAAEAPAPAPAPQTTPEVPAESSAAEPAPAGLDLVEQMEAVEDQLIQMVVSTTKTSRRAEEAPSVVTVVGADEIQARGLTSLADVLRTVPGFYDVYDLAWHNVGVRGVSGGARAAGNVVLVMIDGMPVDDRSTNGNFFGPELIPMAAVDHVEIIRGPASAIYGANAYVGLINVITRKGADVSGARLTVQGALDGSHPGGGGGLMAGGANDWLDVMVAADGLFQDRSGLALPASSPRLGNASDVLSGRGLSLNDRSRPASFFSRARLQRILKGTLSFTASMQSFDSVAEFQDFGPLTHGTRLQRLNQNYRLAWELPLSATSSLSASAGYFHVAPGAAERLDIGRSDYLLLRSASSQGFRAGLEGQARPFEPLDVLLGMDFQLEDHQLQTFDRLYEHDLLAPDGSVIQPAGTTIPGASHGAWASFTNFGAYAQALASLGTDVSAVLGGRLDVHNVYGNNPTGRLGLVWAPPSSAWSVKAMAGASYKAPSAEQLRTQPMAVLDIKGNPSLKAQRAETFELAAAHRLPGGLGEVTVNGFAQVVSDRVEFMQTGLYLQAQNVASEWVVGGELEAHLNLARTLQLKLSATLARTVQRSTDPDLEGLPEVTNPLFPPYQAHLLASWQLPFGGLKLSPELSYVGPRAASQSNALEQGEAYSLPGYLYTALTLSAPPRRLVGETETGFALRLTNLLDQRHAEPGFGGIDVPSQGFTALLTLTQSL